MHGLRKQEVMQLSEFARKRFPCPWTTINKLATADAIEMLSLTSALKVKSPLLIYSPMLYNK